MTDDANEIAFADEPLRDAEAYPEERGEILLEAAAHYRRAGAFDRAENLLRELIDGGGEDGQIARVELAECRFEQGRDAEASAILDQLRGERPSFLPCELVAELLAGEEQFEAALTWYNMAVSRLTDEDRAQLTDDRAYLSLAGHTLAARRGIRTLLGYPPDADDLAAPTYPEDSSGANEVTRTSFVDSADIDDTGGRPIRTLFWPRTELARVVASGSDLVESATDPDEYFAGLQARWAAFAEQGSPVVLVPASYDGMSAIAERRGSAITDPAVRQAHHDGQFAAGLGFSWPPPRNAACWCGSEVKYKKCCGRPGLNA